MNQNTILVSRTPYAPSTQTSKYTNVEAHKCGSSQTYKYTNVEAHKNIYFSNSSGKPVEWVERERVDL